MVVNRRRTPPKSAMARLAYDEHNLYAFIRAYDPHPDSIVSLLSRRDDQTASDQIMLMLDSAAAVRFRVNKRKRTT